MTVTSAISCSIGCGRARRRDEDRSDARDARTLRGSRRGRERNDRGEQQADASGSAGPQQREGHRALRKSRATPHGVAKMRSGKSAQRASTRGLATRGGSATTTLPASRPWIRRAATAECGRCAGRRPVSGLVPSAVRLPAARERGSGIVDGPLQGPTVAGAASEWARGDRAPHRIPVSPAAMERGGHLQPIVRRKETAKSEPTCRSRQRRCASLERRSAASRSTSPPTDTSSSALLPGLIAKSPVARKRLSPGRLERHLGAQRRVGNQRDLRRGAGRRHRLVAFVGDPDGDLLRRNLQLVDEAAGLLDDARHACGLWSCLCCASAASKGSSRSEATRTCGRATWPRPLGSERRLCIATVRRMTRAAGLRLARLGGLPMPTASPG